MCECVESEIIIFDSLQVYMEDSLGDRIWVDLEACKKLVDNIGTLFQTRPYVPGGGSNSNTGTGMGAGIGTASSTSGADSPLPNQSSSGEGGEAGGGGGGDGRQGEELTLADIEVAPRSVASIICTTIQLVCHVKFKFCLPTGPITVGALLQ